ncbi:uncharacterized protein B0I36DRAFT_387880 [Microdochium trichocladiopsis]|uniref:Uncharacterized protein n=1 Tax=Microdochium trichocladiopsis TaxID=1682393 RepID=A0A9P9BKD4_9PEZI|nr:uncharacterized protein B0I36DRAFT_387880 [Microdochium trichocladiopsis]KAH7021104.1 hypothetical protein B0I36DRAFT_387880 [Microdochium trichocladiopsis]
MADNHHQNQTGWLPLPNMNGGILQNGANMQTGCYPSPFFAMPAATTGQVMPTTKVTNQTMAMPTLHNTATAAQPVYTPGPGQIHSPQPGSLVASPGYQTLPNTYIQGGMSLVRSVTPTSLNNDNSGSSSINTTSSGGGINSSDDSKKPFYLRPACHEPAPVLPPVASKAGAKRKRAPKNSNGNSRSPGKANRSCAGNNNNNIASTSASTSFHSGGDGTAAAPFTFPKEDADGSAPVSMPTQPALSGIQQNYHQYHIPQQQQQQPSIFTPTTATPQPTVTTATITRKKTTTRRPRPAATAAAEPPQGVPPEEPDSEEEARIAAKRAKKERKCYINTGISEADKARSLGHQLDNALGAVGDRYAWQKSQAQKDREEAEASQQQFVDSLIAAGIAREAEAEEEEEEAKEREEQEAEGREQLNLAGLSTAAMTGNYGGGGAHGDGTINPALLLLDQQQQQNTLDQLQPFPDPTEEAPWANTDFQMDTAWLDMDSEDDDHDDDSSLLRRVQPPPMRLRRYEEPSSNSDDDDPPFEIVDPSLGHVTIADLRSNRAGAPGGIVNARHPNNNETMLREQTPPMAPEEESLDEEIPALFESESEAQRESEEEQQQRWAGLEQEIEDLFDGDEEQEEQEADTNTTISSPLSPRTPSTEHLDGLFSCQEEEEEEKQQDQEQEEEEEDGTAQSWTVLQHQVAAAHSLDYQKSAPPVVQQFHIMGEEDSESEISEEE